MLTYGIDFRVLYFLPQITFCYYPIKDLNEKFLHSIIVFQMKFIYFELGVSFKIFNKQKKVKK